MVRTWILMVGLIILWASVCPGMEGYSEPAPSEVGPDEAVQPVPGDGSVPDEPKPDVGYGVSEPGSEGSYEVIDSRPVESYVGDEPKPEDGCGVSDPGPNGEVIGTMVPQDGSEVRDSESEGDNVIVTMVPEDGSEVPVPDPDGGYMVLTMASQGGNEAATALISGSVVTSLGILEWSSEWATLPVNTPASWSSVPELAQVGSNVGLGLAAQVPTSTNGMANLADFAARFNHGTSPEPGSAGEAFGTLQIPQLPQTPQMPNFVGNQ
jgi:hypothetical protein